MNVWKTDAMRVPVKSWCPEPDSGSVEQASKAAQLPFAFHHFALMPDAHSGYGVPVGSVFASQGVVVPYFVGVDIGCGVMAVQTTWMAEQTDSDTLKCIMGQIREVVPLGFAHQKESQEWDGWDKAPDIEVIQRQLAAARKQLGTLGGGNHFIEIQKGDDGHVWLMLHSGSRNFGLKVADAYHAKALWLCQKWYSDIPDKDLAFLPIEMREGKEYLEAMNYCLEFAYANRALMMSHFERIVHDETGATVLQRINIHHNYAAFEHHYGKDVLIHRKGATKATTNTTGIIPGSMGTASYIVQGLGNPESFMSCAHGAGRRMGRREAMRTLSLETEQAAMTGIVHGLRTKQDLDEAPGAYKDVESVMANQQDLVQAVTTLRPLAVIKG